MPDDVTACDGKNDWLISRLALVIIVLLAVRRGDMSGGASTVGGGNGEDGFPGGKSRVLCVFMPLAVSLGQTADVRLSLNYPKTLKPPIAANMSRDRSR